MLILSVFNYQCIQIQSVITILPGYKLINKLHKCIVYENI